MTPHPGLRPSGYYWVRFPGSVEWEPAEWDEHYSTWQRIGDDLTFTDPISGPEVGPRLDPPDDDDEVGGE